jgi:hypothetical protein
MGRERVGREPPPTPPAPWARLCSRSIARLQLVGEYVGIVGATAAVVVLLFRMNLPWWGDLLGAGAPLAVWAMSFYEGAQNGQRIWPRIKLCLGATELLDLTRFGRQSRYAATLLAACCFSKSIGLT